MTTPLGLQKGPDDVKVTVVTSLARLIADAEHSEGAEDGGHLSVPLAPEVFSQEMGRLLRLVRAEVGGLADGPRSPTRKVTRAPTPV